LSEIGPPLGIGSHVKSDLVGFLNKSRDVFWTLPAPQDAPQGFIHVRHGKKSESGSRVFVGMNVKRQYNCATALFPAGNVP
jgi:hypothetical protein